MAIHLECVNGPKPGRRLPIRADKPLSIAVRQEGSPDGSVDFALVDGRPVVTNRSRRRLYLNGILVEKGDLNRADTITIGGLEFRIVVDAEALERRKSTDPGAVGAAGSPGAQQPNRDTVANDRIATVDFSPQQVAGLVAATNPADKIETADFRPEAIQVVEPTPPDSDTQETADISPARQQPAPGCAADDGKKTAAESDSDRHRRRNRISATQPAIKSDSTRKSLFGRVTGVFSGRAERARLKELETERHALLLQAGRLSLTNGFGIRPHVITAMLQGEAVSLTPQDIDPASIDRWRSLRQQVALIDSEVAALRRLLQMEADPDTVLPPLPARGLDKNRQDRVFGVMDAVGTDELPPVTGADATHEDSAVPTDEQVPAKPGDETRPGRPAISARRRHRR